MIKTNRILEIITKFDSFTQLRSAETILGIINKVNLTKSNKVSYTNFAKAILQEIEDAPIRLSKENQEIRKGYLGIDDEELIARIKGRIKECDELLKKQQGFFSKIFKHSK